MDRIICKIHEEENSVLIKVREDGVIRFKRLPFRNYFYVRDDEWEIVESGMARYTYTHGAVKDSTGKYFHKIVLRNNLERNFAKKFCEEDMGVTTFEADIDSTKRFLIDNPMVEMHQDKMRKVWMDIETYDLHPFSKDKDGHIIGDYPILSFALKDDDGKIVYDYNRAIEDRDFEEFEILWNNFVANRSAKNLQLTMQDEEKWLPILVKHEKELLKSYLTAIKEYDIVLAYNGAEFDFRYLKDRCDVHGLDYTSSFINDFDDMVNIKKQKVERLKSYALQNVALHEFSSEVGKSDSKYAHLDQVTKLDWKKTTGCRKIFELYMTNQDVLKEYNIQDVHLMQMIEEKQRLLPINHVHARLARCPITDTLNNSRICDYLMLNEFKKLKSICPSKPTKSQIEARKHPTKGDFIGGGFTTVLLNGLFRDVVCFDFKSRYPTLIVEHNISPETYVKSMMPNLRSVFDENTTVFLENVFGMWREFLDHKGVLDAKRYDEQIEMMRKAAGITLTMEELMWEFVEKYDPQNTTSAAYRANIGWTMTPADINHDRVGWRLHPHHIFQADVQGVLPQISKRVLVERDAVKYSLKSMEKGSAAYMAADCYQDGLKKIGNSLYGYITMPSGRFYRYELGDAITSGSRFKLKKTIAFCRSLGFPTTHSDTDSCYLVKKEEQCSIEDVAEKLYDFFDILNAPYRPVCVMPIKNPKTGEIKQKKHFTVFEHEKTLASCIVVKKKRYYFKQILPNGKVLYDSRGGFFIKNDTIPIAAQMQKELVKDILDDNFDDKKWISTLLSLKNDVFSQKLEIKSLIKVASVSKSLDSYGLSVVDGKTGKLKVKKDGTEQKGSVPAHIMIARRMQEQGEEIYVGDKIHFVITSSIPRISGVSVEEYQKGMTKYDAAYYWKCIIRPLIEILRVTHPKDVFTQFASCWGYPARVLERLIEEQDEDDDEQQEKE